MVNPSPGQPPVLVLMGVSGCGKSTVAGLLAGRLGWDLEEGDDLHPAANVDKMASGHQLDDACGRADPGAVGAVAGRPHDAFEFELAAVLA